MKLIITGATGFIGRNLAEQLHKDGYQIVATGRSERVGDQLREKEITFEPADITDFTRLNTIFSKSDCVIHCAARPGDWGRYEDFYQTNVIGSRNVAKACEHHGIGKLIFVSSPTVYFNGNDRIDILETEPLPPKQLTYYGKTKLIAETELMALKDKGYQVMIFRPRAVYGPHDNTIMPRILLMAEKKSFPLINGGAALVDITYVDNFVDALRKALSANNEAWNEIYNVTNGDPVSIKDWFSTVLAIFDKPFKPKNVPERFAKAVALIMETASRLPFGPKEPSMTRFSVGYMAKSMTLSIEKAKSRLGYEPIIGNRESFELYEAWYHRQAQNEN